MHRSGDMLDGPHDALPRLDDLEVASLSDTQSQAIASILEKRSALSKLKQKWGCSAVQEETRSLHAGGPEVAAFSAKIASLARAAAPILTWLPEHTRESVSRDVVAGLTVGVIAIPQGISYAAIAGLPYIYGLYSCCIPPLVYAMFGQSRQLSVGPVAVMSLMVHSGLLQVMTEEECPAWFQTGRAAGKSQAAMCPDQYVQLATLTAFVAGILLFFAYLCNLGILVSFMGHPVTSGYTAGAAIIIIISQLKGVLGFNIPPSDAVQDAVGAILQNIHKTNVWALALSLVWVCALLCFRRIGKRWKRFALPCAFAPVVSCIASIALLVSWPELASEHHIQVVGDLPSGMVPFVARNWDFSAVRRVLPTAFTVCCVGYIEAIAIGKAMAAKHSYHVDPTKELLSLGLCNVIGSMFGAYPVTGSFSRSAVTLDLNAATQLSGIVTALVMWCAVLFLTRAFYWLPQFALAAMVISSILPLVDVREAWHLFRIRRHDGFLWALAFFAVLFLGVEAGIGVAVLASLAVVVGESVRPQLSVLWRVPGTTVYRSVKQESRGAFVEGVLIVRLGASLYFANAQYVKDALAAYVSDLQAVSRAGFVVLDVTPVTSIDSSAAAVLRTLVRELRQQGVQLALTAVGNRLARTLRAAGLEAEIGQEWFFPTVHDAVLHCLRHRRKEGGAADVEEGSDADGNPTHAMLEVNAGNRNHIAFDSDSHDTCTALLVSLASEQPGFLSGATAAFHRREIKVVRAQLEATESGECASLPLSGMSDT